MKLTRMRSGELLALIGGLALVAFMFLPWYGSPSGTLTAWDEFGVVDVLVLIAVLSALFLAVATVTERTPALPVAGAVWTTVLGAVASIAVLVGLLDKPDHATSVKPAGWLSLVAALLILAGAWQSMRDERTELYQPAEPPRRPPLAS